MLKLNVYAKRFIEHFSGFRLRVLCICHGLFDADDLMAFRALAEAMTGVIHFYPWSKPTDVGQFWLFHIPSFPQVRPPALRADLKRLGTAIKEKIGANDLFIAAHARSLRLTLVTNNTREFGRVSRLVVENWTVGA
jgi:hypothetical protein